MKLHRFRFSIASLLILTAVAAFYLADNPYQPFHPRDITTRSTSDANGIAMIHTGIRRHKHDSTLDTVDFVVIERLSVRQELKSLVTVTSSSSDYESSATIELEDRVIELPASQKLIQISDGDYTTIDADVDPKVLDEFLATFSSRSTIDRLAMLVQPDERAEP